MYLEKIDSPEDLKKLSIKELNILSDEIRKAIIKKVSIKGGHLGPELGVVELTVALHYVFNSPKDKIIFDVSHQTYPHKMLTGRKDAFLYEDNYDDVSGFSNTEESNHDLFITGHTSTSLSLLAGLAKARDIKKENHNVIGIIGDGSLSGGQAYEGLNNLSEQNTNAIIVINDNGMSIAENHGGIYKNLEELRNNNGKVKNNFFKSLGLDYIYVDKGHDLDELINIFSSIKDINHPIVVHIKTEKGRGYKYAEEDKETFHSVTPFNIESGEIYNKGKEYGYKELIRDYLIKKTKSDDELVIVTSGVPLVMGLDKDHRDMIKKGQYVDVGITEEHAISFISAMAKGGIKPVYGTSSTFLQVAYDRLSQDLMMNKNPATILVYNASISSAKNMTHLGIFDINFLSHIPNLVYLAPTNDKEHIAMLNWAINQDKYPVAIRVLPGEVKRTDKEDKKDYNILNKYDLINKGKDVAIIGLGSFFDRASRVFEKLKEFGINASLINPKFITGVDKDLLNSLEKDHKLVITLEDGILEGGFGQMIAGYLGTKNISVKNYGIKKYFPEICEEDVLIKENNLRVNDIVRDIVEFLKWEFY